MTYTKLCCAALGLLAALAAAPASAQKIGGTLTVAFDNDTPIPDPTKAISLSTHMALKNVCENLVNFDDDYKVIPQLADKWVEEEGGKTYLFALRKGVKFHNGKEMQAEDVKYSLDRLRTVGSNRGDYEGITAIDIIDPYSLRITLKQPSPVFLTSLAGPFGGYIIPKDLDQQQGGNISKPVCTGPFEWAEWQPDRFLRLTKFKDYVPDSRYPGPTGLGGKRMAMVDQVMLRIITDRAARVTALETGEVDFSSKLDVSDFEKLQKNKAIQGVETPVLEWVVLWLGVTLPTSNDLKFRQAVAAAIDYDEIVQAATDGHGLVNPAFMHPSQKVWRTEKTGQRHKKDLDLARKLLKESAYKGETIELYSTKDLEYMANTALILNQQLAAIGLKTEIKFLDMTGLTATIYAKQPVYKLAVMSSSGRYDPDQHYYRRLHTGVAVNQYSNPAYDKIVEEARIMMDHDKRQALYDQAQKILMDDVPGIVLFNPSFFDATRANVKGFKPTSMGILRFWDVWVDR